MLVCPSTTEFIMHKTSMDIKISINDIFCLTVGLHNNVLNLVYIKMPHVTAFKYFLIILYYLHWYFNYKAFTQCEGQQALYKMLNK